MRATGTILGSVLLALALGACGGSAPPAKPPAAGPTPAGAQAPSAPPEATPAPEVGPLRMSDKATAEYQSGVDLFSKGDVAGAKAAFERAIVADEQAYQAHYSLAVLYDGLNDQQAATSYRRAFAIKSDYAPAIVGYALYLARKNSTADAERFLEDKRGKMPASAAIIAALAEVKSLERDTASAQQLAQEALKKESDYKPAMVTIARDHYRNRRLDLSLYALQAILDGFGEDNPPRDKNNADAHYLRGIILKEEGRKVAAMTELHEAVRLRPELVAAHVELAAYALESGNVADALPQIEWALRYDPNNVSAHLNLGDCYRLSGRYPEAKKEFDWVALKDSGLAQVHYDLALLYLFAPSVPGMDPKTQADTAIAEITKYQQMRGRLSAGQSDDSEELLNRAKQKQADILAQSSAKEPLPAPAAGSAAPAAGSAVPAGSAAPAAPAASGAGAAPGNGGI
jgi:Tfp pilus assembly protein PilF